MAKYAIYGYVEGTKYLGTIDAVHEEEALEKGWELAATKEIILCHHCSPHISDPAVTKIVCEKETEEENEVL